MCARKHSILSWFLITLMVMLPLRSALASDLADCRMKHEQAQNQQSQASSQGMHHAMMDHSEHMMSGTAHSGAGDSSAAANAAGESHQCCNDKNMMCNSDCASVINMSFVIQSSSLIEIRYHSVLTAQTTVDVLLRALPPLDRPPAFLQS